MDIEYSEKLRKCQINFNYIYKEWFFFLLICWLVIKIIFVILVMYIQVSQNYRILC